MWAAAHGEGGVQPGKSFHTAWCARGSWLEARGKPRLMPCMRAVTLELPLEGGGGVGQKDTEPGPWQEGSETAGGKDRPGNCKLVTSFP